MTRNINNHRNCYREAGIVDERNGMFTSFHRLIVINNGKRKQEIAKLSLQKITSSPNGRAHAYMTRKHIRGG